MSRNSSQGTSLTLIKLTAHTASEGDKIKLKIGHLQMTTMKEAFERLANVVS